MAFANVTLGLTSHYDDRTRNCSRGETEQTNSSHSHDVVRGAQPTYGSFSDRFRPAALTFPLPAFTGNSNGSSSCAEAGAWAERGHPGLQETWLLQAAESGCKDRSIQHSRKTTREIGVRGGIHGGGEFETGGDARPRKANGVIRLLGKS